MSVFNVELKKVVDDSYDIEIGYNLKDQLVDDLETGLLGSTKKLAVITDSNVRDLYAKPICEKLIHAGIDTGLYNFPRCVVDHKYWVICKDSISDYKIRFTPECNNCKVRSICGGVFNSTLSTGCFKARPILE